jgi:hypothetical protein
MVLSTIQNTRRYRKKFRNWSVEVAENVRNGHAINELRIVLIFFNRVRSVRLQPRFDRSEGGVAEKLISEHWSSGPTTISAK